MIHSSSASFLSNPSSSAQPLTEELIAVAIAGVIGTAKAEGRSLDEITQQVLADDHLLDRSTRAWLSEIMIEAWERLPEVTDTIRYSA